MKPLDAETVEALPEVEPPATIVCETDRYDGPIGGFVEANGVLYRFSWCLESRDPDRDLFNEARLFALQRIPDDERAAVDAWIVRYRDLGYEATVIGNPDHYPVSAWQRERMRSSEEVQRDYAELDAATRRWKELPVTHCMYEFGDQFAAIHVVTVDEKNARRLVPWQTEIAHALAASDYPKLEALLADAPIAIAPNEIYRVKLPNGEDRLCDARGKPLPPDFWMSGRYQVLDHTSFITNPKA